MLPTNQLTERQAHLDTMKNARCVMVPTRKKNGRGNSGTRNADDRLEKWERKW